MLSWLWKLRPGLGPDVDLGAGAAALGHRDLLARGRAFLCGLLHGDMLQQVAAQMSHFAPPGLYPPYHLALFWIKFLPGAPLAAMAAPAVGGRDASPVRSFCWPGCPVLESGSRSRC